MNQQAAPEPSLEADLEADVCGLRRERSSGDRHAYHSEGRAGAELLYTFDKDEAGKLNCYDDCAVNWPPFLAAADAVPEGEWTIIERTDGTKQ